MLSFGEENYIIWIYVLSLEGEEAVNTNSLAEKLNTKAASITDMIKKLSAKELVLYEKYKGVLLTPEGKLLASGILRRQRLWKVFLVDKLHFNWDEVAEDAEKLEHIGTPLLISRLNGFLGYPKVDPAGEPIPDASGNSESQLKRNLDTMEPGDSGILVTIKSTDALFLRHLDKSGITLGCKINVINTAEFDGSMEIKVNDRNFVTLSKEVISNLILT